MGMGDAALFPWTPYSCYGVVMLGPRVLGVPAEVFPVADCLEGELCFHHYWIVGCVSGLTNHANKWIKAAFKDLRQEFGGCCAKCGSKEKLQFAHLQPTDLNGRGRGRKERYYDIVKHRGGYQLLCEECHRKKDSGEGGD